MMENMVLSLPNAAGSDGGNLGSLGFVKEINWIQILNLNDGQRCEGGVKACDTVVSGEGILERRGQTV